jgi:hypothetical protein
VGVENTYTLKLPQKIDGVVNGPEARAAYFNNVLNNVQASIRNDIGAGILQKPAGVTQVELANWGWNEVWTRFAKNVPGVEYNIIKTNLPSRK